MKHWNCTLIGLSVISGILSLWVAVFLSIKGQYVNRYEESKRRLWVLKGGRRGYCFSVYLDWMELDRSTLSLTINLNFYLITFRLQREKLNDAGLCSWYWHWYLGITKRKRKFKFKLKDCCGRGKINTNSKQEGNWNLNITIVSIAIFFYTNSMTCI